MAISYNKLWKLLIDKKMTQAELRKAANIAPNTMTKLRRDEPVNLAILGRACEVLDCDIGDIMEFITMRITAWFILSCLLMNMNVGEIWDFSRHSE